jgi:hypothetical protein
MLSRSIALLLSFASLLAPVSLADEAKHPTTAELNAKVPELMEFHTVIFQLWHKAWPEKDYEMMKELLPAVREGVRNLETAELPGILRDKKMEWEEGLTALQNTLKEYADAASADDGAALLDAVEKLHARFEDLIQLVRPVMPELEAYHQVLYGIFHYYLPNKDLEQLQQASAELTSKCLILHEAPVPERFATIEEDLETRSKLLCDLSRELQKNAGEGGWEEIEPAADSVHSQYLKVAALFD